MLCCLLHAHGHAQSPYRFGPVSPVSEAFRHESGWQLSDLRMLGAGLGFAISHCGSRMPSGYLLDPGCEIRARDLEMRVAGESAMDDARIPRTAYPGSAWPCIVFCCMLCPSTFMCRQACDTDVAPHITARQTTNTCLDAGTHHWHPTSTTRSCTNAGVASAAVPARKHSIHPPQHPQELTNGSWTAKLLSAPPTHQTAAASWQR
jgi:hypothetical protein